MKKTITQIVLTAALIMMSASCQKEEMIEPMPTPTAESKAMPQTRTLYYSVDGVMETLTYHSEAEWYNFMTRMTTLARAGHTITLSNTKQNRPNGDFDVETIVYDTRLESDAIAWCKKMNGCGYTVSIRYYADLKLYHCLATRHRGKLDNACLEMRRAER